MCEERRRACAAVLPSPTASLLMAACVSIKWSVWTMASKARTRSFHISTTAVHLHETGPSGLEERLEEREAAHASPRPARSAAAAHRSKALIND